MTDNFYFGRVVSLSVYFAEGFMTTIGGLIYGNFPSYIVLIYAAIWLISMVLFIEFGRKGLLNLLNFPFILYLVGFAGNVFTSIMFGDAYINLFFFTIYLLADLFFFNKRLIAHTIGVEVISFSLFYILPYDIKGIEPETIWLYVVLLFIAGWIEVNLVDYLNAQSRKNIESERSMDDMLKVIEMKCDEARVATRGKITFISNISHEIRTPINSIMGFNEMIQRDFTDEKLLEYSQNIENSSNELLSLINDILDFSKIGNGKMKIIPVKFELSTIIEKILQENMSLAEERKLNFICTVNPKMPEYLYGDDVRIKQIIDNLVSNAIKYTDEGSVSLDIDFETMSGRDIKFKIAVTDTGHGIKVKDIKELFESYDKIRDSSATGVEGNGIGLAITKSIIELMNGSIDVESKYGQGSIFSVVIPVVSLQDEVIGNYKDRISQSKSQKPKYHESFTSPNSRILFVDDNNMNLKISQLLLKKTGMTIDTAASGLEAIEKVKKNVYDIIFLDHMMPLMDGVETLEKLKNDKYLRDTPVIALTANTISGARDMYMDYGFSDYLSKPIDAKLLENTLIKWLPKDKVMLNS